MARTSRDRRRSKGMPTAVSPDRVMRAPQDASSLPVPADDAMTMPADDAATKLLVQPLMQLQSSRKLNKALTRMLQHEQARSLRLELQLEAERKRSAANTAMKTAHTIEVSSDEAAVAEAEAAEAAGAARRAEVAVVEALFVEDSYAHDAAAAAVEAAKADILASRRAGDHGIAALDSAVEEQCDADDGSRASRITSGLRRLLRSAPAGRSSSVAAFADAGADRNAFQQTIPTARAPRAPPMPPRRPRSAGGFLLRRNPAKPLRVGMIMPMGQGAPDLGDDRRSAGGHRALAGRIPSLSMPAPFEWPEDIASPAPRWARSPSAGMLLISPRSDSPHTPGGKSAASPRRVDPGAASASAGCGCGPAPVAFSSALLGRMQAELQAELMRLQEETQQLIEGCAAGDFSRGADAAAGGGSSIAPSVRALSRRLGWVRSDLSLLRQMATSRERRNEVSRLRDVATAAEEFARSLRSELANDRFGAEDPAYVHALAEAGLRRVEIARDGNCLFACAAAFLSRAEGGGGGPGGGALTLRLAAVAALRGALVDEEAAGATAVLDSARMVSVGGSVGERIDAAIAEALCSGSTDASSVALRRRLGSPHSGGDGALAGGSSGVGWRIGGAEARRTYLDLMATEGVFGERLEIEALASVLHTPILLYYSLDRHITGSGHSAAVSASPAGELPVPVEIIEPNPALLPPDPQLASPARVAAVPSSPISASAARTAAAVAALSKWGQPMRLLHLVAARHFDLLVPLRSTRGSGVG